MIKRWCSSAYSSLKRVGSKSVGAAAIGGASGASGGAVVGTTLGAATGGGSGVVAGVATSLGVLVVSSADLNPATRVTYTVGSGVAVSTVTTPVLTVAGAGIGAATGTIGGGIVGSIVGAVIGAAEGIAEEWNGQDNNVQPALQEQQEEINKVVEEFGDENEELICKICFENPVDRVINPCGHTICSECAGKLPNGKCPFCKKDIEDFQKIFFS